MGIKEDSRDTFELQIRGRSKATQIAINTMAKHVLEKKIKEKLTKKGVDANVKCHRKEVTIDIEPTTKVNDGRTTTEIHGLNVDSPLVENEEKK